MTGLGRFAKRNKAPPAAATAPAVEDTPVEENNAASTLNGNAGMFGNVDMFGGSFDASFASQGAEEAGEGATPQQTTMTAGVGRFASRKKTDTTEDGSEATQTTTPSPSTTPTNEHDSTTATTLGANPTNNGNLFPPIMDSTAATTTTASTSRGEEATIGSRGLSLFARKRATLATPEDPGIQLPSTATRNGMPTAETPTLEPDDRIPHMQDQILPLPRTTPPVSSKPTTLVDKPHPDGTKELSPPPHYGNEPVDNTDALSTTTPVDDNMGSFGTTMVTPDSSRAPPSMAPSTSLVHNKLDIARPTPSPPPTTNHSRQGMSSSSYTADKSSHTSFHHDGPESFDDLLSFFLGDLREQMDLLERGNGELLDLQVDLAQAFSSTLRARGDMMDLHGDIEVAEEVADSVIEGYSNV